MTIYKHSKLYYGSISTVYAALEQGLVENV